MDLHSCWHFVSLPNYLLWNRHCDKLVKRLQNMVFILSLGVTFVSFIYFYWTTFDECQWICNLEFLMRYFGACFSKTTIGIKRWDSFDYHSLINKEGRRSTREMHTSFHQIYDSLYNFIIPRTLINVYFEFYQYPML